jgi:hypothetical protein
MPALEHRRDQTLDILASSFAAGHVREGTLEHRVEAAIRARSSSALDAVTWDLPPHGRARWRALLRERFERPPAARITFHAPSELTIALDEGPSTYLVGRSRACDIVLRDPQVSRHHALISVRGDRCSIRNLASTNGTEVNGRPITTAVLHAGDRVCFGRAVDALVG